MSGMLCRKRLVMHFGGPGLFLHPLCSLPSAQGGGKQEPRDYLYPVLHFSAGQRSCPLCRGPLSLRLKQQTHREDGATSCKGCGLTGVILPWRAGWLREIMLVLPFKARKELWACYHCPPGEGGHSVTLAMVVGESMSTRLICLFRALTSPHLLCCLPPGSSILQEGAWSPPPPCWGPGL